jgi:hypothetical protein
MMKPLLSFVFICLPLSTWCQCSTALDISIGGFRTDLVYSADEPWLHQALNSPENSRAKSNIHASASYCTYINHHLYLKVGLQIAAMGHKYRNFTRLGYGSQFIESLVWRPVTTEVLQSINRLQFSENHLFIGVPFILGGSVGKKKLQPFIEVGAGPALYVRTRLRQSTNLGREHRVDNISIPEHNKFQIAGTLSLGLNYAIAKDLVLYAGPTVRYHFTPVLDAPVTWNLYGLGVSAGVRIKVT